MRFVPTLLITSLLAGNLALAADREAVIESDFRKVERRLDGSDGSIRDACATTAKVAIEDRPAETSSGVTERISDVTVRASGAAAMRPCVRGILKAGVVEGWTAGPATEGTAGGWTASLRLHRARRNPNDAGARHTEQSDREAAARLTALWKSRAPVAGALVAEVLAPDLVSLREARWNAGNFIFEGTAEDERFVEAYQRLLAPLLAGLHVEWKIDVVRPDDASRFAVDAPKVPPAGLLRAAFRAAPPGAILRALAEIDRRDFVVPSAAARDGSIAGGWNGIAKKLCDDLGRSLVHVGAIDVFAPSGTKEPARVHRAGKKVDLDLEAVDPAKVATLLGVAGGVRVDAPAGLARLDLHLRAVPWEQALDAVAIAAGCAVETPAPDRRLLRCSSTTTPAPEAATLGVSSAPPLERAAAAALRVCVLATREDGKRWIAGVATPEGLHVTVRTGVRLGLDGGHAVVDAHGVTLVLERADAQGNILFSPAPLLF